MLSSGIGGAIRVTSVSRVLIQVIVICGLFFHNVGNDIAGFQNRLGESHLWLEFVLGPNGSCSCRDILLHTRAVWFLVSVELGTVRKRKDSVHAREVCGI